jgi:spore maturation protein CgeB
MPSEFSTYIIDQATLSAVQAAADLPTEHAQNGMPTLTFSGRLLHSARDPLAEALSMFENSCGDLQSRIQSTPSARINCFVYGPGLGYVLTAIDRLARETNSQKRLHVVCVEADVEVARKALQLNAWGAVSITFEWVTGDKCADYLRGVARYGDPVMLACTAGYRTNKPGYDAIMENFGPRENAERPMRILVPTPLYGGSYPVALHCADALKKLGHHVDLLDLSSYYPLFRHAESVTGDSRHRNALQGLLTTYLAELIAARAMENRADLVWAVAQTPLTPAALQEMRHEGIHSALWFVEDFRVFSYWRELAPHFDAVFTIQSGEFHSALQSIGVKHVSYLPCAANPETHKPAPLSAEDKARYGSKVSFVGAGYPNRQRLFSELTLPGLKLWGCDWPSEIPAFAHVQENGRRVATEETAKIFLATDVNLNLHSWAQLAGVNPHGDFVNPRTFEIAACGAFQLVDARSELPLLFDEGREMIVFRREDEILELVNYYLDHETERKEIARRARERVLREHTYGHRMASALEFLERRFRRLSERKRGPNYISSLKRAAGDDVELLDFLSAFSEDEEVDLDKIVARIQLGNGDLSRPEGLFLLMKEFRDWGRDKGVIQ